MEKQYKYVLTSRFQTDCLELRFSKYRQMSGGRFLFGLREMQVSERVLSTMGLLKASINIWNESISPDADDESMWSEFEHDLELLELDIDNCMLDEEGVAVVTVIAAYLAGQTNKNTKCDFRQELLTRNTGNLSSDDYLNKLSRGGLATPSTDLVHYVAKSFAILDCVKSRGGSRAAATSGWKPLTIITKRSIVDVAAALDLLLKSILLNSNLPERKLSEYVLNCRNAYPDVFLCNNHKDVPSRIHRIITNIYFNNKQKKLKDSVRKDSVKDFKQRQRKRQKTR